MQKAIASSVAFTAVALVMAGGFLASGRAAPATAPATPMGWTLLKEGQAEGTIEPNAKHATNPSTNILRIAVTKYAAHPGEGRVGAKSVRTLPVEKGQWYDITFNGISEGIGVGLVLSLEADAPGGTGESKVLARTTLPEIGRGGRGGANRGRRGGATTAPSGTAASQPAAVQVAESPWRPYLVSLNVRESAPAAHLVITPIEAVPVLLDNIKVTLRTPPE